MFPPHHRIAVSPELRVTVYYFVQAMSVGAVNAFAGIWLVEKGISPSQIGVIFAAPVVGALIAGVPVGRLADRADDWRQVIVVGAAVSAVVPFALYGVSGFWSVLVIWTVVVTAQMVILPVTDAAALRLCRRADRDFGHLYAWKTLGYLLVIFTSGWILARSGIDAFLPLFVALSLMRGVAAFGLPRFRHTSSDVRDRKRPSLFLASMPLWLALPLVGWSLVHGTHFVLNGYLGLLWHEQGFATRTIGGLIALSGIAEMMMFFAFQRVGRRFGPRVLIGAACLAAVVRWGAISLSPGLGVAIIAQLLHALTYALGFLACTNFIADWTEENIAAEAQSTFVIIQSAIGVGMLIGFGWLYGLFGAHAFLASAALAGIGAGMVAASIVMMRDIRRSAEPHSELHN